MMLGVAKSELVSVEAARRRQVAALMDALVELLGNACSSRPPRQHDRLRTEPFGFRMRLTFGPVRQMFVSQHASSDSAVWIRWNEEHGAYVSPAMMWSVWPLVTALVARLHGDELELAYALAGERPILARSTWVHPDGWWDSWKTRAMEQMREGLTVGDVYRQSIYPSVLRSLDGVEGTVLDVCGGDGELAARITERTGARVIVMDRNRPSCAAASERGQEVVCADVRTPEAWMGVGAADAAVLVGAISGNVMRRRGALEVMGHLAAALRDGAGVVVAGWNPCLLEADDFRQCGFDVINCVVPPDRPGMLPRQHYVLRRVVKRS